MGMHVCGQAGGGDGEHGGPLGTSLTSLCVCRFMAWLLPSFRVYACRFIRFVYVHELILSRFRPSGGALPLSRLASAASFFGAWQLSCVKFHGHCRMGVKHLRQSTFHIRTIVLEPLNIISDI